MARCDFKLAALINKRQTDIGQFVAIGSSLGLVSSINTAEIRLPVSSSGYAFLSQGLVGIVALIGVVVNDSLVMVDYVNQMRAAGHPINVAVVEAGCARFRAIVLTSLTTFFGLIPIMMETSLQAQF